MTITINNKSYEISPGISVEKALDSAGISTSGIAVAVNNSVVKATDLSSKTLNDGDSLTVIKAFYGG